MELFAVAGTAAGAGGGLAGGLGTIASLAGTVVGMAGQMAAGKAAEAAAEYEAKQHEVAGKEKLALAQREARDLERKKDLALSTLQTNAAGSGFTATDPTALLLARGIDEYGEEQKGMAMYSGRAGKEGSFNQAAAARMSGKAAKQGATYKAFGTLLSGFGTIADRYNPVRQASSSSSSRYFYG